MRTAIDCLRADLDDYQQDIAEREATMEQTRRKLADLEGRQRECQAACESIQRAIAVLSGCDAEKVTQ